MLLTCGHQIGIVCSSDMCAPTDRFTSGLTYFSRSRGQNVQQIVGTKVTQIVTAAVHTETVS